MTDKETETFFISKNTWYPLYLIDQMNHWRPRIQLTKEEFADFSKTMEDFDKWQKRLLEAVTGE